MTGKITWSNAVAQRYELGAKNAVLYPAASDGTYKTGIGWSGITAVTDSPDGADSVDLYADNKKYASFRAAETFGGTIEAYTWPDEWSECDGSVDVSPGVTFGQQRRKPFGLSYRTEIGNAQNDSAGYKLHLIYNATTSPSEKKYETINDSPDAVTFSWEYTSNPVSVEGIVGADGTALKPVSSITLDSTKCNLSALEAILYGKDSVGETTEVEPRLPLPAEVVTLVTSLGN